VAETPSFRTPRPTGLVEKENTKWDVEEEQTEERNGRKIAS
jgi:hypothetical protein